MITCIWYALAVIGFSGEFFNYFSKIWSSLLAKRRICLIESINLKALKAFASVLHLGNYTAFIIVAALYGPCQMGLTPVKVVDFNVFIPTICNILLYITMFTCRLYDKVYDIVSISNLLENNLDKSRLISVGSLFTQKLNQRALLWYLQYLMLGDSLLLKWYKQYWMASKM